MESKAKDISISKQSDRVSITTIGQDEELEKRFSLMSTCALQYSLICSSIAIGSFMSTVIGVGGAPVLIFGFILAVSCDLIICYSMAELASAFPHSSGQVQWTYILSPNNYKRILSYFVGILTCAGWIFACFSVAYTTSMFCTAMIEIYHPDFVAETWHYYMFYIAIALTGFLINGFAVNLLPVINYIIVGVINAGTLFIVITLLIRSSPKRSVDYVFKDIVNETGWSSNGLVFCLGLLPSISTVSMFDGACHMTDEIPLPERNIPLVMVIANSVSGIVAFLASIVYMFCISNPDNLFDPVGGQPFIQLMYDSFQSKTLTTIGTLVLIVVFYGSYIGYICSASRLFWSFSKSNGLPFSNYFNKVNEKFKTPMNSLILVTTITSILGCMIFGSSTALNAVLGTCMVCVCLSYVIPIICLLITSGFAISPHKRFPIENCLGYLRKDNKLPYFCLGKFGLLLNIIAVCWTCFIMIWLNFPSYYPVTSDSMNYACAVLGVNSIFGFFLWFLHGKKNYEHNSTVEIL